MDAVKTVEPLMPSAMNLGAGEGAEDLGENINI